MAGASSAALFALAAFAAASLPFFFKPGFGLRAMGTGAGFALHALVSALLFTGVVAASLWIEAAQGQRAEQRWEFFAVMVCLWGVAAFPGFLWRYLRRARKAAARRDADADPAEA
ncbi:MAG TPA: DUF2818 family protein [Burkholderiaceae bacterium]|nr:DUF2818 family protein [Burkholderiaceae bacterium]